MPDVEETTAPASGPTAREIVALWLRENGYDGLYYDDCGCSHEDVAPCSSPSLDAWVLDCRAGYKRPCDCGEGCDWHIGPRVEPAAPEVVRFIRQLNESCEASRTIGKGWRQRAREAWSHLRFSCGWWRDDIRGAVSWEYDSKWQSTTAFVRELAEVIRILFDAHGPVYSTAIWIPATKRALSDASVLRRLMDEELAEDSAQGPAAEEV